MSLYRTMLFTPANDLRKVGKALMLKADGVVLDLEDAVAISEKTRARLALKEALALPRSGDVFIRVNSAQTDYILADLLAYVTDGARGTASGQAVPACRRQNHTGNTGRQN
jgi:citrate lyase subunit beta/citryl-CoA lyase